MHHDIKIRVRLPCLCLWILAFVSLPLWPEDAFVLTDEFNGIHALLPHAAIYMDETAEYSFDSLRMDEAAGAIVFSPVADTNLGISSRAYWIRLEIESSLGSAMDVHLQVRCPYINELNSWIIRSGSRSSPEILALGRTQLKDGPAPLYRYPEIPLTIEPDEDVIVYLRLASTDNVFFDITLMSSPMFIKNTNLETVFLTTTYGILLAMILLNGILLIGTPDRRTVMYIVYMTCLLLYLLSADGILFKVLMYRYPYLSMRSNYFLSIAAIASLLVFVRYYLEIDRRQPWSNRLLWIFVGISMVLAVAFAASSRFETLLLLAGTAEVLFLVFLFITAVKAALKRQRAAYYFLASWGVLIVLVFLTQLRTLGLLPPMFLTTGSLNIGAAFQVIVLSVGLADRINALLRENALLKTERQRIEEEYRQKIDFFINISHELRTPLTMLQGVSGEFAAGKYGERIPRDHPGLASIVKNLERIDSLIKRISGFIRMDQRLTDPEKQVLRINDLLAEIAESFKAEISRKGISFLFTDASTAPLYAEIDSDLFRSVVENLLGNALQYTQYGSIQVILDGPDDADNALIKVADTGIGIPAASINTVFRRFVRLPAAQALRAEGLGVGLSLVRKIVELHGAAITVQSTEGRGSEFSITWPVLLLGMQNDKYIDMNKPGISQYAGLDGSSTSSSIQYSVLVVEDDPDLLDYLSTRLADAFYVQTAQSANLALERLESGYIPDIIISDIMMPGMDGIQFFENIRSEQEYASIPFLFLTARDLESEKLSLIEQGAVDYITKPFSMDLLIARINMILSLKAPGRDEYITQVTQRCHERGLSERQTEIVHLLLQGRSKKDIAACLKPIRGKNGGQGISVKTVDNHVQKLYEAFGVHSQYELMALFTPAVREASSDSVANKNS